MRFACLVAALLGIALAAAPARAALLADENAAFAPVQGFADPRSVAVDDAGRVYVADAGAGRVLVFDSASGTPANRLLRVIGEGQLQQPVAVAVDNRQRVYVGDAGRNRVFVYDTFFEQFKPLGTLAEPGTAPGRLDGPVALTTDPGQRVFVAEAANLRVSVFRPARGKTLVFQSAFGIAHGEPPVEHPTSLARDAANRLYLTNAESDDGFVRAVDRRGRFIANLGKGTLRTPTGVAVDRFDRVLVADTGNDRLVVYGPVRRGAQLIETFAGPLAGPRALALAPGSLLYALQADRIVRLRYDDADRDGVTDAGDNCLELANGDQDDTDGDGRGNACDDDDDGDAKADAADRCATERGAPDGDGDGCRDAQTRIAQPDQARTYDPAPTRLAGSSDGGTLGVDYVEAAIGRRLDARRPDQAGARCAWLVPARRAFIRGLCRNPRFFRAVGRQAWRVTLTAGLLSPGPYVAAARAKQLGGPVESTLAYGRNLRVFRVR